ncbi:hypothetical protein CAI21_09660 [Alkalilimnicola ehrlichii]|uniref:Aminoglycoside phosphotransferase domain-containing protein n=1 Tax=Alkalilimnicola ehrlichii TaxID=351052 RepID=A0A3E0WV36_9GAMM|nr:phosphotransferase [Alkalilimnicola ehrlichii]RFA29329.1 hypothetical protein CAI21_09660 [Alkalilimnicola ehrlichii]RFA36844.1 hypothetical protein CAL65_09995 [Alkalilimnicola ehrlichii]
MKLSSLLQREEFWCAFSETISDYLASRFCWQGRIERPASAHAGLPLRANIHTNLIYPSGMAGTVLRRFAREYAVDRQPLKRIARQAYVTAALSPPFEWFLSRRYLQYTAPPPANADSWVYLPGNHSIRVMDWQREVCHIVRKKGCSKHFLEAEIDVRSRFPWLPIPPLNAKGADNSWFEEPMLHGLPLARLSGSDEIDARWQDARSSLAKLYAQTRKERSLREHCDKQLISISAGCGKIPHFDELGVLPAAQRLSHLAAAGPLQQIEVCQTHGDFNPSNVLCTEETTWIIDWEYSQERSRIHDALIFVLRAWHPPGMADRLRHALNHPTELTKAVQWTGAELNFDGSHRQQLAVFLLEETATFVNEAIGEGVLSPGPALSTFSKELTACVAYLSAYKSPTQKPQPLTPAAGLS